MSVAMEREREIGEPSPVTELGRLIVEVQRRENRSFASLARRSARRDGTGGISRQRMHQLATAPFKHVGQETAEALQRALGVPLSVINDAISQSVGTFVERGIDLETRRLLARVHDLSAENKDRWLRLARALTDTLAAEDQKNPDERFGAGPSPSVTTEHLPVAPDVTVGLARLGEVAQTDPALIEAFATFSDAVLRRYEERDTGR